MQIKQHDDGTITLHATFKPEDLPRLIQIIKTCEEARVAGFNNRAKEIADAITRAETELNDHEKTNPQT